MELFDDVLVIKGFYINKTGTISDISGKYIFVHIIDDIRYPTVLFPINEKNDYLTKIKKT